jgi:hypothetical protein
VQEKRSRNRVGTHNARLFKGKVHTLSALIVSATFVSATAGGSAAAQENLAQPTNTRRAPAPTWSDQWNINTPRCNCDWPSFAEQRQLHSPNPRLGATISLRLLQATTFVTILLGIGALASGDRWMKEGAVAGLAGTAFGLSWYGVEVYSEGGVQSDSDLEQFDFCFSRCPLVAN